MTTPSTVLTKKTTNKTKNALSFGGQPMIKISQPPCPLTLYIRDTTNTQLWRLEMKTEQNKRSTRTPDGIVHAECVQKCNPRAREVCGALSPPPPNPVCLIFIRKTKTIANRASMTVVSSSAGTCQAHANVGTLLEVINVRV